MTLRKFIDSLPKNKQFELAIELIKKGLSVWEEYATDERLTYNDTVVGMRHTIDKKLLKRTVDSVDAFIKKQQFGREEMTKKKLAALNEEFLEPIAALQDLDWKVPHEIERIFYAVYNLYNAGKGIEITVFGETSIYVAINQAIDALESSGHMSFEELKLMVYKHE
jgi:hypothetical protein